MTAKPSAPPSVLGLAKKYELNASQAEALADLFTAPGAGEAMEEILKQNKAVGAGMLDKLAEHSAKTVQAGTTTNATRPEVVTKVANAYGLTEGTAAEVAGLQGDSGEAQELAERYGLSTSAASELLLLQKEQSAPLLSSLRTRAEADAAKVVEEYQVSVAAAESITAIASKDEGLAAEILEALPKRTKADAMKKADEILKRFESVPALQKPGFASLMRRALIADEKAGQGLLASLAKMGPASGAPPKPVHNPGKVSEGTDVASRIERQNAVISKLRRENPARYPDYTTAQAEARRQHPELFE